MSNFTSSKYDKYFSKIYTENKHLYQWTCKLCGLVTAPTIHTTTEIRRHHLKTRHPEDFADIEPRKVRAPIAVKKRKVKDIIIANTPLKKVRTENDINSDKIDNTIMELISSSSFPISTINDPAFDRLLKLLNPIYILKNKDYFLQEKLPELYTNLSTKIKMITSNLNQYSIVINIWKEYGFSHSLLAFTIHFLNDELKPQHFILALQPINLDKIMLKLYERLEEIFGEFNLDWSKVTHIIQAGNLESEDLECDPEWHVEICLSLGLQVSIEDAMKDVQALDTVILKVKKLLRKLRKSKTLKQAFIDYQKLEDFPEKCLDSEVQIFWDILYSIFLSFQQNKISLQVFCVENGIKDEYSLDQNEWKLLEEFLESLSGFFQAASLLSRPDTTISSIIPIIKVIMLDLETKKKGGKGNAALIDGLLISLQKRFSNALINQNNIIATLLDPRFKDKYLSLSMKNCYKEWIISDIVGVTTDITVIVPKVEVIEDEIDNNNDDDLFALFEKANETKCVIPAGEETKQLIEAELIKYLHEPRISRESSPSDFWHINSHRFPYLQQLFCKHATAPAINIEADKFFSISGAELDKMRKSLNNQILKQILFLNCNFKLFDSNVY